MRITRKNLQTLIGILRYLNTSFFTNLGFPLPKVHDSVVDSIPQFDLILTRHTMMHLKLKDGAAMLKNFYNSGSHFLLATNFAEIKVGNLVRTQPADPLLMFPG